MKKQEKKAAKKVAATGKVALILRAFAKDAQAVPQRVAMLREMITTALSVDIDGEQAIKVVHIVVPEDRAYGDVDCGLLAPALQEEFAGNKQVRIHRLLHGDIFCAALNFGIFKASVGGSKYSIIASAEARSYMNAPTLEGLFQAMGSGAKVAGVAINELQESILEGRIANTFAMWDNEALSTVAGFSPRAAKPRNDKEAVYMRGWSEDQGEVFYPLAGVEEMIPLARLVKAHGKCIAVVMPRAEDGSVQHYELPTDPEMRQRHIKKMGTKFPRQCALLASEGMEPSVLAGAVMK